MNTNRIKSSIQYVATITVFVVMVTFLTHSILASNSPKETNNGDSNKVIKRIELVKIDTSYLEQISGNGVRNLDRTRTKITKGLLPLLPEIETVYSKFLQRGGEHNDTLTIQFLIISSGKIIKVTILDRELKDDRLENEVNEVLKKCKYRKVPKGTVTVKYSLVFNAIK